MTPSEAYATLHEKWPELRPAGIYGYWSNPKGGGRFHGPEQDIEKNLALSACFVACVEACAKRGVEVLLCDWVKVHVCEETPYVNVPYHDIHSIASVMDRVMQLPEVPRA